MAPDFSQPESLKLIEYGAPQGKRLSVAQRLKALFSKLLT